jgi:outer membrane lipoprotein SlyB
MEETVRALVIMMALLTLTGCVERANENRYDQGDVGVSHSVEFGTIINAREVDITGKNSGTGTLVGAAAGAGAGSYVGSGSGSLWAALAGGLAGAAVGTVAEQDMQDHKGYEYVVQMQSGEVKTIVQEKETENAPPMKDGQHAMLQYCDAGDKSRRCSEGGHYQRLIPIKKLPPYVSNHRKAIKVNPDTNSDSDATMF